MKSGLTAILFGGLSCLLLPAFSAKAAPAGPNLANLTVAEPAGPDAGPHDPPAPIEPWGDPNKYGDPSVPHAAKEFSGDLASHDGLTLRVVTDFGSVRVVALPPGSPARVRYTLHVETDARGAAAQALLDKYIVRSKSTAAGVEIEGALPPQAARSGSGAQFWVQFLIAVPAEYNLDVHTEAGDIETSDIGGLATLVTQGGNIRTGRLGLESVAVRSVSHNPGAAAGVTKNISKLHTEGGHVQVADVLGDLNVFTGGGHINVGNVSGDATLRSGGGHIRAGQINGRADLGTDGGNITVGRAGSFVNVRTGGGQIDFGEVHGSVRAQTGGGGIRVMYVAGPMEVESSGGSICLTRVAGAVQAATADGTITAWISPEGGPETIAQAGVVNGIGEGSGKRPRGMPEFVGTGRASGLSGNSDVMVQLAGASQLASGNGDIVVFLPRNLAATIEATVAKGDERRIEADPALHLTIQNESGRIDGPVHATGILNGGGIPLKLRTTSGKIRLEFLDSDPSLRESRIREQQERLKVVEFTPPAPPTPPLPAVTPQDAQSDWLERWLGKLEVAVTGGLREDPDDFRNRLTISPHPAYPELAQRVGIQGAVKLQVKVTTDGRVEVMKVLQGEPVLADSAINAVKQWRGKPAWVNGKPAEVISTVTFNFQLR
jgi:TonB family protein